MQIAIKTRRAEQRPRVVTPLLGRTAGWLNTADSSWSDIDSTPYGCRDIFACRFRLGGDPGELMVEEQEEAEDSMETGTKDGQKVDWEEECGTGEEGCCMLGNSRNEKSLGGG